MRQETPLYYDTHILLPHGSLITERIHFWVDTWLERITDQDTETTVGEGRTVGVRDA